MQYLKQFLAFLFSRQMLAFVAMVLLALAIWFVGPLLAGIVIGFGGFEWAFAVNTVSFVAVIVASRSARIGRRSGPIER